MEKDKIGVELTEKQRKEARDAYRVLAVDAKARGESWPFEPKIVTVLSFQTMSIPFSKEKDDEYPFGARLANAFKQQTGQDWNPEKYAVASVTYDPQLLGGTSLTVVFEKARESPSR